MDLSKELENPISLASKLNKEAFLQLNRFHSALTLLGCRCTFCVTKGIYPFE